MLCEGVILCIHLSSSCGGNLPCDLSSLKDLRTVDFQFVQLFSYCDDRNDDL